MIYNDDHNIMQYCDDVSWIGLGNSDVTTSLANLTDTNVTPADGHVLTWDNANSEWIAAASAGAGWQVPDDAAVCNAGVDGTIRYNSNKLQLCIDGTGWVDVGGGAAGGLWTASGNDIYSNNSGNVGIGTTTPDAVLDVEGGSILGIFTFTGVSGGSALEVRSTDTYPGIAKVDYTSTGAPSFALDSNSAVGMQAYFRTMENGVDKMRMGQVFGGGQNISVEDNLQLAIDADNDGVGAFEIAKGSWHGRVGSDGTALFRINNNGNVGIGTTSPQTKLHITGTSHVSSGLQFDRTDGSYTASDFSIGLSDVGSDGLSIRNETNGSTDILKIDDAGNVGIGTSSPAVKLDVVGTIRATELCDENGANCNDLSSGDLGSGGSGVYTSSEYVKEFSGIIAGPGNWPACTDPQKIVTIGTVQDSTIQSFLDITVYGSHRGYNNTNYFDHKKFVVLVGDKVSSLLTENNGTATQVNLYDGTTSGNYNTIEIGAGFDIRLSIQPSCGSTRNYTYVVRYYNGMNFTPHATRSW